VAIEPCGHFQLKSKNRVTLYDLPEPKCKKCQYYLHLTHEGNLENIEYAPRG
jgi:hypothetical protein